MIARIPGPGRPRSRVVIHDVIAYAVATALEGSDLVEIIVIAAT